MRGCSDTTPEGGMRMTVYDAVVALSAFETILTLTLVVLFGIKK